MRGRLLVASLLAFLIASTTVAGMGAPTGAASRRVQAQAGAQRVRVPAVPASWADRRHRAPTRAAAAGMTLTVTITADTPDSNVGDGVCADANGACTLRAAIAEANTHAGDDTVAFDLAGTPPVRIALATLLPEITSRVGTLVIDGYTQPGSRVNDAAFGSNAVPGVELYGAGASVTPQGLLITSPGNTIRGLVLGRFSKAIFLTGVDAHHNTIVGNWVGYRRTGANTSLLSSGVAIDGGAHDNTIGTPALADRNVIGNAGNGVDLSGAGTDGTIVQGNLLCTSPDGMAPATCKTAIDLDFGVSGSLIGGDAPGERNVVGPTMLQAIELSHAWDPHRSPGVDPDGQYAITGNQVIGNWLGFRGDGSYDPDFRSGLGGAKADNGNGINVIDGPTENLIARNVVSSLVDGIQVFGSATRSNQVVGNVIGLAPRGGAAPLEGWGMRVRLGARDLLVEGNRIASTTLGGIGLTYPSVRRIRITRNIITNTRGPAIDLYGKAGPDPNDPGDRDGGANTLLNTPLIAGATTTVIQGTGVPGGTVEVYRASKKAGQHGLPVRYIGSAVVAADGTWRLKGSSVQIGQRVTALQIRSDGNTSELAPNRLVVAR